MSRPTRGRPSYSSARLVAVYMAVELKRHEISTASGKPCGVLTACKAIAEALDPPQFHGVLDSNGMPHYAQLSPSALRGAYYRAMRAGSVKPKRDRS